MDLSINKVNTTKKINFKGLEGAYDNNTTPVFKFIAPAHKKNERVFLEIAPLTKNKETSQYYPPTQFETMEFKSDDTLEINQKTIRRISSGFAYRYRIANTNGETIRYEIDPFKSMTLANGKDKVNVIEQGKMYGISPKGGAMRHSFLDSDVRLENGTKAPLNEEFVRNHFNKLGGSINGLLWLLQNTDELEPYRYLMTTPDIGMDKVSSHRYWPSNQYQCSNLETFKDFNFELFKQGKGYVADGAFTSQGIQSSLVQHVLKWGEESPFYNMLKIDGKISLGVLPDVSEATSENPFNHIGVRLVNAKGANYDKNRPTYIQLYDDRLLSQEKQNDGELHFDYDKSLADHYEITTHQDSVQPYAFEINPDDRRLKIFEKEGQSAVLLKTLEEKYDGYKDFLTFPNYSIAAKNSVSGTTCWDGNVDIIKMNLSNPTSKKTNHEGYNDAREYLLNVASYWTQVVQADLILKTAKSSDKMKIAFKNDVPQEVLNQKDLKYFDSIVLKQNKDAQDYVQEFPLQSLETSEELNAIFAQKEFKKEFLEEKLGNKKGGALAILTKKLDDVVNEVVAQKYSNVTNENVLQYKNYKAYVLKTYSNEILRYIFASAFGANNDDEVSVDLDKLKSVTLKSLEKYNSESPRDERKQVILKLNEGLNNVNLESLTAKIKYELKDVSLNDFKLAEMIVLQGKGGLNWRFDAAKDIGDLDAVRDGLKTFDEVWNGSLTTPGVQQFWADFVSRIKESNPASYVINEVTSLDEFVNDEDPKSAMRFDHNLTKAYLQMSEDEKKEYENRVRYAKQVEFLNVTNSTTTSEYDKGFNKFSVFAGVDPEHPMAKQGDYNNIKNQAGNLHIIKNSMDTLMKYYQPNSATYCHMFVSNHDKPSVLHVMPLNMYIYLANDLENLDKVSKEKIQKLTKRNDLKAVNPKAAAVGIVMSETIDRLPKYSMAEKTALKNALSDLVNGKKTPSSEPNYKRAESFGVKPFEITIQDMFKNSKIKFNKEDILDFHYEMMKDSMTYFERMWQVMNAYQGIPTLYGGNEFAQTGYETPSRNIYLGIRNEILHDLKNHKNYKAYYEKINDNAKMYLKPALSALRDGAAKSLPIISTLESSSKEYNETLVKLCAKTGMDQGKMHYFIDRVTAYAQGAGLDSLNSLLDKLSNAKEDEFKQIVSGTFGIGEEYENHTYFKKAISDIKELAAIKMELNKLGDVQIWPIYRKNARGSEVISVVTNLGLPYKKASCEVKPENISYKVSSISLKDKEGKCSLDDGTILRKVGDETSIYLVKDGAIVRPDDAKFVLNDTVSTFYVDKNNVKYRI